MSKIFPRTALLAAAIVVAAGGVFWLPWYIGGGTPVPGESYALGFDNRVGVASLAVAIGLATLGVLFDRRGPSAIAWFDPQPRPFPSVQEAAVEYAIFVIASIIWGNVLWAWGSYLVDPAWAEARGFHYGIDLLAIGKIPYRDFMFNYGPATLYVPYGLSWLSGGDLSFEWAYLVTMVLFTVAGFGMLFAVVRTLALPAKERAISLGLSLLAWAAINMGLHYTPLRFFVVPGCVVLLDTAAWRARTSTDGIRSLVCIGLAAAVATFACLAVSPEMGIAGSAAVIAYSVPLWLADRRGDSLAVCAGCLALNAAMLLEVPDYLLSVVAFASGGGNFPIYPNLHNLALVGMALYVLPRVLAAAFHEPTDRRAGLAMGVGVGGGMMLPAALGRCDPGHVFINTTVLATLMFGAAWALSRRAWVSWAAIYSLLFIVMLQYSYWSHYYGNYVIASQMRNFYETNPAVVGAWQQQWERLRHEAPRGDALHWSSVLPFPQELETLANQGEIMLTAGNEWNLFLARFLVLQKNRSSDYFHAYSQGAASPSQIDRKVRESLAARFLLVPAGVLAPLQGGVDLKAYERGIQSFLSTLLLFPVRSAVRRAPYLPDTIIAKRLLEYFEPIGQYQNYVVFKRKGEVPPETGDETAP